MVLGKVIFQSDLTSNVSKPTLHFRWLACKFYNHVLNKVEHKVLQQKHIDNSGNEIWINIETFID